MATTGRSGPKPGKRHSGQFRPGQSGNPSGRPKATPAQRDFESLCRVNADKALAAVLEILRDSDARPDYRLRAAEFLADRGFGKPVGRDVQVQIDGNNPARLSDAQLLEIIQGGRAENVVEIKQLQRDE